MDVEKKQYFHMPLLVIMIIVAIISCIAIASAKPLITYPNPGGYWSKQLQWYIIGFVAMYAVYKFGSDRIYSCIWIIYWLLMISLLLLALKHRFGLPVPFAQEVNGATSWFQFPGVGGVQPSEFMKMAIIIALSKVVQEHNELYTLHTFETDCKLLAKVAAVSLPPCLLIYLQNDAGVTMIIAVSVIFLLFASGLQMRWFIVGVSILLVGILVIVYIFLYNQELFKSIFSGHKAGRFYGWLDPEGTYGQEGYQLFNALLSYGTASVFGHGFQSVVMNFPEAHTDFIFAVICQGGGLFAGVTVLTAIVSLDITILKIGIQADEKGRCLTTGLFGLLFIQQIWNIFMITGLLPITGITLPFISYGGSSLLSYMLIIGMIFDIEKQNRIKHSKLHNYE
ncbi:MAG: FtsW/RodA/SpoVE family cell cycle protein [Beduini sp.]|uniref:FtsW/RodA/SpoVE family cell cycle protein n=1 Tax=Beduini sp. TaxID=1922300 RepID=UPI0039A36235